MIPLPFWFLLRKYGSNGDPSNHIEITHKNNVATNILIPTIPVLSKPILFLMKGKEADPATPITALTPTNTPRSHAETHCDKQYANVMLSKPSTVM